MSGIASGARWETSVNEQGSWDICEEGGGDMVADVVPCAEAGKRAALLAAAPELLEALEQAANALLWGAQEAEQRKGLPKTILGGLRYHAKQARAAIAKATGKDGPQ